MSSIRVGPDSSVPILTKPRSVESPSSSMFLEELCYPDLCAEQLDEGMSLFASGIKQ